jgi:alkylhydroperoxidase/carboxymuconolactone decarboxylase family protein YurZ
VSENSTRQGTRREPSGAEKMFGDFSPGLAHFTDDVLFGEVWRRTELTPKERSLVTVAALATNGNTEQLVFHLGLAKENGNTEDPGSGAIVNCSSLGRKRLDDRKVLCATYSCCIPPFHGSFFRRSWASGQV